ncbi:holo-ACP synthase, partial [Streptomyces katsurahamanus]
MIIGVGIDVAEIDRFAASLRRTPQMADRLFLEREMLLPSGERRGYASLAARFAAKEAVAKALGAPAGLHWTDAEVYV